MEKKILLISHDESLREVLEFCFDGWGYEVFLRNWVHHDIKTIKKISPDVVVMDVCAAKKDQLEMCHLLKDDFTTAFIPIITLIDKRQLRTQLLTLKYGVDDYLIKPPDPLDLRVRVEMALRRAQYSYYASSLTGLPGGRIIEEVVNEKLSNNQPFVFGYVDVDHFKYFNDVYGYLKGDLVIMQTAYMLYNSLKQHGNKEDFIGHIGGDDFVFITTPDRYMKVCHSFIALFDRVIPFHYSLRDRRRGFIIARDRTHKIKRRSLMSISVAVVNRPASSEITNVIQINERVAEIKHYLKGLEGSHYMADRRNTDAESNIRPVRSPTKEERALLYKPLGQILIDADRISQEQLDEALRLHWKRGLILGETLKELGFLKEKDLQNALKSQQSKVSSQLG